MAKYRIAECSNLVQRLMAVFCQTTVISRFYWLGIILIYKRMALRFNKVIANTRESDHYCTPKEFYDKMDKEFGFTFDPCPLRCETFNGLEVDWKGIVYVNPPYSHVEVWIEKGIEEIRKGNAEKVCYLIPLRTDSWYWHNKILAFSSEVRLVRGRLRFGDKKDLAPFGVALIVFDKTLSGQAKLLSYEARS